ncbi:MAG TPA: sensor histidine kinase [Actinomycetota bacterium]|nr:sensor histidine kinase [Actinomycetota bacterium]
MAKVLLVGGVSASMVVALVVGVRRHRPDNLAPWYALIIAQAIYLAGDLTFYTLHHLLGSDTFPSAADALYLGHYPFVIAGVLLLVRSRAPGGDPGSVIDAGIIATGFGVVTLVFLIEPTVGASELPRLARLVIAAYPIMDMLVLAVAVRLLVGVGRRRPAFHLFTASLAVKLATDSAYCYLQLVGLYEIDSLNGRLVDAGWLACYLLLGAAALHPSMSTLAERDLRTRARFGRGRLLFLAGSTLLAPAAIVIQNLRGQHDDTPLVALVCVVLFLLVVNRMSGLIREVETNAAQLRERGTALQLALVHLEKAEAERKRLLDRTMRGAEQERTRIAAELHDGPIQRLTAIGYQLEEASLTLGRGDDRRARTLMAAVQRGLRGEVDQLRGLMATLRPPVLDERGLTLALADELDSFERRTGIACTLKSEHDTRLEPEIETVLYRVVQEALTNVAKHARARKVSVSLGADDDRVDMQVQDDGVGFDAEEASGMVGNGHFGLAGMRERVELAAGTYHLRSTPGSGTLIHVRVPRRVPA